MNAIHKELKTPFPDKTLIFLPTQFRKLTRLRVVLPALQRRNLATAGGTQGKPRVVVLGSGWGGFHVAKNLDKDKYDVRVISPANHFLFTPLLPSTAVGTLEFRCIQEPVRTIPGLGEYYQAKARTIDFDTREISCSDIFKEKEFKIQYDFLVIATGAKTNTFNTPGVDEREGDEVMFLKHLYHSRKIRNRILECFERASVPSNTAVKDRDRLLSFVVVGGGPTSCEFTGELHDFVREDCTRWFPDLKEHIKITLVEAGPALLGGFEKSLSKYVLSDLKKRNVDIRLGAQGRPGVQAILADGTKLPFGMMVWSAGLKQVKFVDRLNLAHGRTGRLVIDEYLQVPQHQGRVFALGDCAANEENPLAPLAKVAQQHGEYLAKILNTHPDPQQPVDPASVSKPFRFFNPGSMAQLGLFKGVLDLSNVGPDKGEVHGGPTITGFAAWLTWRSAYWGKQVSLRNKILIPMHWFKSFVFGRDICRF
eukprot:jgi/Bigna1/34172/e_gw1.4.200.1